MVDEKVAFTPNLVTVVVDLHRRMSEAAMQASGLAYLPCCVLASVRSHAGKMAISDFPRTNIARENTIVAATVKLERAGLLVKTRGSDDGRIAVLHETDAGVSAVERAFDRMYRFLCETVWSGFDAREADAVMQAFTAAAAELGIPACESGFAVHDRVSPAFPLAVAALMRVWSQTVLEQAGVSLTEYRLLALLESARQPLPCFDIAEALMVDRSTVSVVLKPLRSRGMIRVERGADGRQRVVATTDWGACRVAAATAVLERQTAEIYKRVDSAAEVNDLHARLYDGLVTWAFDSRPPGFRELHAVRQ